MTVQGPVKKQQPDGMSHRGSARPPPEDNGMQDPLCPPAYHRFSLLVACGCSSCWLLFGEDSYFGVTVNSMPSVGASGE